jgi:purine-binding chemotaxis protein CheW
MAERLQDEAIAGFGETNKKKFVTFTLGGEEYGVEVSYVREVRRYEGATRIANTPEFIKGVINLRGVIVPVVDLRIKFHTGTPKYDEFTVNIIVEIGSRLIGMVVDSVSDVVDLSEEEIKPAPAFKSYLGTQYVLGLGTIGDRMIILIDIANLLTSDEMQLVDSTQSEAKEGAAAS